LAAELRERGEDGPWSISGLPRAVVKLFVNASLGAGRLLGRWPQGRRKKLLKLKEGREPVDLRDYKVREVAEAVLRRHPILSDLSGIDWGRLQFVESRAVVRAVLRLKREFGVPSLPIHDSLIVPVPAWWLARDVLTLELRREGCEPVGFGFSRPVGELPRPEGTRYAGVRGRLLGELCDF
jgi:hypothetical protein